MVPASDVDVGDVIVLPGSEDAVLVRMVRLAQGQLIFTVTSASDSTEQDSAVRVTAMVRRRTRGRDMAQ